MKNNLFPYKWNLKDGYPAKGVNKHGLKVFSCFSCAGGSTMGYKLAGYDVIGCNEIDPRMMEVYRLNHNPKYSFLEAIQDFKNKKDLPEELYNLDILDGSPPCSSFSIAGNREKDWGQEKKFREGQSKQILDTLFFDFIDLAKRLQPKVVIAENVKGLLLGNAKKYVDKIIFTFEDAGYSCVYKLLNSASMGVPQRRERVFFIAIRKDLFFKTNGFLNLPKINLNFSEKKILFKDIKTKNIDRVLTKKLKLLWDSKLDYDYSLSDSCNRLYKKKSFFNYVFIRDFNICNTITAHSCLILFDKPRFLNNNELISASTFPQDFNFLNNPIDYIVGMSVPPIMMAQIASRIYTQVLQNL